MKPTDYDLGCTKPCTTLTNHANQSNESTLMSTTFLFLEGIHYLDVNFIVMDSENISLRAFPRARVTIDCGESSRFVFDRVTNLVIENITFLSCGIPDLQPGILLKNVSDGNFINVTLLKSNTTALFIQQSDFKITNLTVAQNTLYIDYPTAIVVIENSDVSIKGKLTITQNNGESGNDGLICTIVLGVKTLRKAVVMIANSTVTAEAHMIVADNVCKTGIVRYEHSTVTWKDQEEFDRNSVCVNGALGLVNTTLITGDITFSKNSASYYYYPGIASVAALYVHDSSLEVVGSLGFYDSYGDITAIESFTSHIRIVGQLQLINNTLDYAYSGIILRPESSLSMNGSVILRNNTVYDSVIRTEYGNALLTGNAEFTENSGASVFTPRYLSKITFEGIVLFSNNSGIMFGVDGFITFNGSSTFINNNVGDRYNEGGMRLYGGSLTMIGEFLFERNKLRGIDGGVIYTINVELSFEGYGQFVENSARNGGVFYLQDIPRISIGAGTELLFEGNEAQQGAVFHMTGFLKDILCTDSEHNTHYLCSIKAEEPFRLTFRNNTAAFGGSLLHVSFLEDFDILDINITETSSDTLTRSDKGGNSDPLIATDSFRLCFCENDIPVCNITSIERTVSRGEHFIVSVAALTLFNNNLPRTVSSYFKNTSPGLSGDKPSGANKTLIGKSQQISSSCTEMNYRVYTTEAVEEVEIAAVPTCEKSSVLVHCLTFNVTLGNCPRGFSHEGDQCICDKRLRNYTQLCDTDNNTLSKEQQNFWIGVHLNEIESSYLGLILYPVCPFDYCLPPPVAVDLSNLDAQCSNHRSGILCGQCQANKSLTLGDLKCSDCSNNAFLLLIIPMVLLGIGLVGFLFLTGLTVASGVVNGLILYANILGADEVTFKLRSVYGFNVFIAWVNLDFGIPTCFHNGMTHLTYTAWQFAFPLYLWLLVAFIIILCHYSIRVSKFFAKTDPVAVLATLVLLSYNKLLRNILTILTPATLEYPPESNIHSIVWRYDGNVGFAQGGHAVLVIVALASLVFLFLPFTLVLVSAQFLQKNDCISRCFHKCNLSHPIKSYQEPYKPATRYWIGLCLLLRCVIQIILVSTSNGSESANVLAISTICTILISIIGAARGVYSNRWLDILELSYIFNLGVLSAVTFHLKLVDGNQVVATYMSTVIAFVTFLVTVVLVSVKRLKKSQQLKKLTEKIQTKPIDFVAGKKDRGAVTSNEVFISSTASSVVDLREELLESNFN